MSKALRIVMLLTDGFGGYGGIAKFNRDFLEALDACTDVERVDALPRIIQGPLTQTIPEAVVYDRRSADGRWSFIRQVTRRYLYGRAIDIVICAHPHLVPAAWPLARLKSSKFVLILHGIDGWAPTSHWVANRLIHTVDSFITPSEYSAQRFAKWSNVSIDRGYVIPNCVDLSLFKPQPRDPELMGRYNLGSSQVILTVSRLISSERYKGVGKVLELMPRLLERFPQLRYLVVGEGDDRARLEAKAKSLGLAQQVIFAGLIPESEKAAHYSLADVFVLPSKGEGFGIVFIEAAACGIPVIGADVGGSREALLGGRLGRLVDSENPTELVKAIVAALDAGKHLTRNPLLETFSVDAFRKRVSAWVGQQTSNRTAANEI